MRRGRLGGRAAVLAINALLALGAVAIAFAEPGAAGPELRLAAGSGSLALSNSREGEAIFSAAGMRPGSQAAGTVRIANGGSVAGALQLARAADPVDVPGAGGGRLSERLQLAVVDVTDAPVTVYSGRLKDMPAVALGTLAAGAERSYRFVATLPVADNAYQGARLAAGFTWSAVGSEPAPTPTPTASPSPPPAASPVPPAPVPPGGASPQPPVVPPAPLPPGGTDPAADDPTGAILGAQVFPLPSARRCLSRRSFKIRIRRPRGVVFASMRITINGRAKVKLTGLKARKVKARVNLRGLPKGKVVVKIVARTTTGRKAASKRTYRTCAKRRRR